MTGPALAAWLEGSSPSEIGKRLDLGTEPTRLGRGSTSPLPLSDPMISREHCEIRCDADGYFVVDLGSTHGTFVNDQPVQQARLRNGSRIRLGTCEFVFRLSQDAIPTALVGRRAYETPAVAQPAVARPTPTPATPAGVGVPSSLPAPAPTPAQPSARKPGRSKLLLACGAAAIILACVCLAVGGVGLVSGVPDGVAASINRLLGGMAGDTATEITPDDLALALAAPRTDERPEVLERLGLPDEFDVSIVEVEGGQVRLESWRYYGFGTRVDFADGVIVWTIDLEPVAHSTLFPAWYDPTAFEAGMTPEEVTPLLVAASPAGTAPETIDVSEGGEDLAGLLLLAGDQITIGFENGGLVYVETLGMTVQEGGR